MNEFFINKLLRYIESDSFMILKSELRKERVQYLFNSYLKEIRESDKISSVFVLDNNIEDLNYDDYFKVVYSSVVIINEETIKFKYTEEDGMGVTLEVEENGSFIKVNSSDKFEFLLLDSLFSQSPIDFDNITVGEDIVLSFDYYEEDNIIEF